MLADRVRIGSGSGNNYEMVNIQVKDSSTNHLNKIDIMPIIKEFELDPSQIDKNGMVNWRYLEDEIIPLYCGDAVTLPRRSTINVTTLKSKYFIISWNEIAISGYASLINRDVTIETLSYIGSPDLLFRLSEDLEDGDIIDLNYHFD